MDTGEAATPPEDQSISPDRLGEQLTRAVTLRVNQDQVLWRIFAVFWAANAGLLVALFREGRAPTHSIVTQIVTSIGVMFSITWFLIQRRAIGHLSRHEALMERIERRLQVPPQFAISAKVNEPDYAKYLPRGLPARQIMILCSALSAFLWTVAFIQWGMCPCSR